MNQVETVTSPFTTGTIELTRTHRLLVPAGLNGAVPVNPVLHFLGVETDAGSYKVRRIRRNPRVIVAPCGPTGRFRGAPVTATAELLPDAETGRVERLMARKYRVDLVFIRPIRALQALLHPGRMRERPVILAITPR